MSYPKIKGRMTELGYTQKALSARLGMYQSTLSLKLSGERPMNLHEAEAIAAALNIPNSDFAEYFFNHKIAQRN